MITPIRLETRRFILREFLESDRRPFLECHADPAFARFHTDAERTEGHAGSVFDLFLAWQKVRPRTNVQLVISRGSQSAYLGNVGIRTEGFEPGAGEIGIEIVKKLWGTGAADEVLQTFGGWVRREMGITLITAETAPGNRAAERIAETAGLQVVGEDGKRYWRWEES